MPPIITLFVVPVVSCYAIPTIVSIRDDIDERVAGEREHDIDDEDGADPVRNQSGVPQVAGVVVQVDEHAGEDAQTVTRTANKNMDESRTHGNMWQHGKWQHVATRTTWQRSYTSF